MTRPPVPCQRPGAWTAGPWELTGEQVRDNGEGFSPDIYYRVGPKDGLTVALVDATPYSEELIMNARLIAAAPELAEQVRRGVDALRDCLAQRGDYLGQAAATMNEANDLLGRLTPATGEGRE